MHFRQVAMCVVTVASLACSHSGAPRSVARGYALSTYGSNLFVPPVINSDGRSIFGLNGSLLLAEDGTATATFRYRIDSNSNPESSKIFSGTWTEGGSGRTIELNGATASETKIAGNGITMTASWTDSGVLMGGVFGFTRVLPE